MILILHEAIDAYKLLVGGAALPARPVDEMQVRSFKCRLLPRRLKQSGGRLESKPSGTRSSVVRRIART